MAGNPSLPRIDVDLTGDNENEITPTTPNNNRDTPGSPNMLATPTWNGRDRSLSGSTQFSTLKVPNSSCGEKGSSASSIFSDVELEDALKPDPGHEKDFEVKDNKFAFSPGQLNKLLNPKSLAAYKALGGIRGIERGLRTDLQSGLSADENTLDGRVTFEEATQYGEKTKHLGWDEVPLNPTAHQAATDAGKGSFVDRLRVYSNNALPEKKATPLWKLMWMAYNDKVLILLTVAAAISLALGLYETFGVDHPPGSPPPVDWIEGCAICIAIIIVVLVGSLNDYQKERAFVKLNAKKENREVKVIRSGKSIMISVHDVLAGDILHLEPGDMIPVDGIFIGGHNVKCDESSATGESDALKKVGGEQVMRMLEEGHTDLKTMDCFIISGSKVLEGIGTYMATSVGVNSSYGKILMAMRVDMQPTPLQVKLDGLATAIAKLGTASALLLFFVLLFRFVAQLGSDPRTSEQKASAFLDILIVAVTVIVVAVPEGLPLAVTLALAFATTRLVKLNNLVRILKSCETMGNATTVCSDKTGTLTTNVMTVVTGTFGERSFDDKNKTGSETTTQAFAQQLGNEDCRALVEAIAVNSTAFESDDGGFVGSKTETALLAFARVLGMGPVAEERANARIVQLMPFDSARKCMGAVVKLADGSYKLLIKGASEILLGHSTQIAHSGVVRELTAEDREHLESVIDSYAQQSLRTIALISRNFTQWPPVGCAVENDPNSADMDLCLKDMTFDGLVGIQDPVRPGVPEAVAKCHHAGVSVRMVTGDNVTTAKAIATECGIYTGGVVMEGPVFRTLDEQQMNDVLPKLQVLARSSPEDKRILVTALRAQGEIVAVTGDGTNDGPALKAADIGFSMGIAGTEVAKEASAIILMDDNFASILTALMWGRAVNDAVRKFLQFQITVNITAVIITFVSAVANADMKSVLTAVQLLWINLIMDSMAALALASDAPTEEILDRKPAKRSAPLISVIMWKMIIGQAIYQLVVTFILYYVGPSILNYPADGSEIRSVVFNTFVWFQVFNMLNNRRLDNKFNIFVGAHRNYFFLGILAIMIGCQVMIMYVGGRAFSIQRIDGQDWGISIVLGLLSLPWAVLVRLFPDAWFTAIAKVVGWPVVQVYRPLSRWTHAASRKIRSLRRKRKESADVASVAEQDEKEADAREKADVESR
ncbi:Calcium-transporting ATPase 2 [Pseudocercospora fuligena]|uniref:Calcium-transporting ATPase n=1 Tax=Pseudocercospora fuligena TaxID=685502 RepID=A0A8H6RW70_9PEZI|nr:Calcium-transporting ATPase 2 [Pseudocercospora fuligena]